MKVPGIEPTFNPSRRRFLRTALFAALAGCRSSTPDSRQTPATLFRNRPFPIGNSSVSLKECNNAEQTATFEVSRPGCAGLPDSMTLLVPGSFTVSGSRSVSGASSQHEIYVGSVSCGTNPQSAEVSILESAPVENAGNAQPLFADLPVIGAAIAFFGLAAFWITHCRKHVESDGTLLSPKRQQNHNHLITR